MDDEYLGWSELTILRPFKFLCIKENIATIFPFGLIDLIVCLLIREDEEGRSVAIQIYFN